MLALPDPNTAFLDPFCAVPTLSLTCSIAETGTKELYTRDPRDRPAGREVPALHRPGRRRRLRAGGGIFYF